MSKLKKMSLYLMIGVVGLVFFNFNSNAQTEKKYAVALKVLNVLSAPSSDASVLYIAQPGERMDIVKDLGLWLKVRAQNGVMGYVQSNLVRIEIEKIIQPPPSPKPKLGPEVSSSGVQPVVSQRHHRIWPYLVGGAVVAGGAAYLLLSKNSSSGGVEQEQKATLKISSSPADGTVYVDGQEKGETPCTIEVSAGEHEIKVKRDLYGEWSKKMNVMAGQEYTIQAKLAPYKYEFDFCFGGYGKAQGKFNSPSDVTVDDEGKIYVADYLNARIDKFNASGGFITSASILNSPYSILYSSKNNSLYVVGDSNWGGFSYLLNFSTSLTQKWKKALPYYLWGFDLDDKLNVYITLLWENKLLKLDSHGNEIAEWNVPGGPMWAAVGQDGNVYITLNNAGKIAIYSPSGSKKGEFPKSVPFAISITTDRMGHFYVTSSNYKQGASAIDKIYKFLPDGKFVFNFAKHGTGDGELNGVTGIAVAEDGSLYVTDANNYRICKWRLSSETASQATALITSRRKMGVIHSSRKFKGGYYKYLMVHRRGEMRRLKK